MENKELTIEDLLRILQKWWYLLLLACVLGGFAASYYTAHFVTPLYSATTRYYVDAHMNLKDDGSDSILEMQRNTAYSRMIVSSYIDVLDTYNFAEKVADTLNAEGSVSEHYDYMKVYRAVSFKYDDANAQAETYSVTVTVSSAADAKIIADTIERVSKEYLPTIISGSEGTIKVTDNARESKRPINSNTLRNMLIGVLLGFCLAYAVLFFVDINDVHVRSQKDLTQEFGLPVLGTIPEYGKSSSGGYGQYGRY